MFRAERTERARKADGYPVYEAVLGAVGRAVRRPPAGEELEQHDAVGEYVRLLRQLATGGVLGSQVAERAHDARRDVRVVAVAKLGQPEIRNLQDETQKQRNPFIFLQIDQFRGCTRLIDEM
jgi:hypothetical protein